MKFSKNKIQLQLKVKNLQTKNGAIESLHVMDGCINISTMNLQCEKAQQENEIVSQTNER